MVSDMTDRVATYESALEMLEEVHKTLRLLLDSKEEWSQDRDFKRAFVRSAVLNVNAALRELREGR